MKVKKIPVYEFKELNDTAKDKVREWHSQIVSGYNWWDYVVEEWVEKLKEKGINTDIKQVEFSGFASQGDGASFTGTIDVPKFMLAHGLVGEFLPIYAEAVSADSNVWAKLVRIDRHYCHSRTVDIESSEMTVDIESSEEIYYLEQNILGMCREYMNELYKELQNEWEHRGSDESIIEDCEANNWMFDASGRVV